MREKDRELRRRRNRRRKRLKRRLHDELTTIKKAARSTSRKRGDKTAGAGEPAAEGGKPAEGRAGESATRKTPTKRAPKKPAAGEPAPPAHEASRAAAPAEPDRHLAITAP